MRSLICRLPGILLQRSVAEQPQQVAQLGVCLPHLSDLQQLAAAALGGTTSSNSSSRWQQPGCSASCVRGMSGRAHKLSLKKANNKASWLAVAPYLQRDQPGSDEVEQQQRPEVIQSAIPPLPTLEEPVLYQRIGRITGPYSVGTQPCFAVMESGGSQWKVTADDVIYHNKIPGAQVNDVLEFKKVLLLGSREDTTIGRPFVPGASVVAAVEENFKDAQVYVFKKKVRKRYSKLQGHRSHITALRILEVRQPQPEAAALAASTTAAAALTNVARLGVDHPQAALDMLGRKLSPHQLKVSRRSSRPAAAAAQTAAAGATQDGQDALAADQPGRQGSPHRGRRRFGPPAVLNATAGMSEAARSNAQ